MRNPTTTQMADTMEIKSSLPEGFDPVIARTFILPFDANVDSKGIAFAEDHILINLGEDIDRRLVCVTTNKIARSDFSLLFPTTTIGMANLITSLINTFYASLGPEEWAALLNEVE